MQNTSAIFTLFHYQKKRERSNCRLVYLGKIYCFEKRTFMTNLNNLTIDLLA